MKPPNTAKKNVQVRLDAPLLHRVTRLVDISGINESEIIRQCIRAGLPLIETGKINPFTQDQQKKYGAGTAQKSATSMPTMPGSPQVRHAEEQIPLAAETPAIYRRK